MLTKGGLFIVIEGTDGSGKGTQTKLLLDRLQREGFPVASFDFPQYHKPSSQLVRNYLQGEYGTKPEDVSPKQASLFYAVDRFDAAPAIRKALGENKVVVANRYVASNMGHQGAKFSDDRKRMAFFKWLDELEYHIFNIPQPDINIILHVPAAVAQKLVDLKKGKEREFLEGKKRDLHEGDLTHLERAEKVYLQLAELFPKKFQLIECAPKGKLFSLESVHGKIWQKIKPRLR